MKNYFKRTRPAFVIGYAWERYQGIINKWDILVSGIAIFTGVYLGGLVFNWLIN